MSSRERSNVIRQIKPAITKDADGEPPGDDDLALALHTLEGGIVVLLADSITGWKEAMQGSVIYTCIYTGFFSFNVTATAAEICAALGLTPLMIGEPWLPKEELDAHQQEETGT